MIDRIELINFMSHPHTVLELDPGLTVLVGENNCGKSAIVNALKVLCTNASGDYMVRHGQKECVVRVHTSEGHTLEWKRKKKVVSYTLNGREVHRLGSAVPDDLHTLLRLPQVETDNGAFDIHFGDQKDPIFLLNSSAGKRASFFASSSDTIKLIEMQNLHKKKVREARQREADLQKEEAKRKARLERLKPIQQIEGRLVALESMYNTLCSQETFLSGLRQALQHLDQKTRALETWKAKGQALSTLEAPPQVQDTGPLQDLVAGLEKSAVHQRTEQARKKVLQAMHAPPELENTRDLRALIHNLEKTEGHRAVNQAKSLASQGLYPPPELDPTQRLGELIEQQERLAQTVQRGSQEVELFARLRLPPETEDVSALHQLILRLEQGLLQDRKAKARTASLHKLAAPPEIADVDGLRRLISAMQIRLARVQACEQRCLCLQRLTPPFEPMDLREMQTLEGNLNTAQQQVQRCKARLEGVQEELAQVEDELRRYVAQVEICPTCGQAMDPDGVVHTIATYAGGQK